MHPFLYFLYRSSRPDVFCKKGVLKNFAKFTGKNLCQSLFFNKVADLRPTTLLKKRLWHRCFPVNFAKFFRTSFLTEHFHWPPLSLRLNLTRSALKCFEQLTCKRSTLNGHISKNKNKCRAKTKIFRKLFNFIQNSAIFCGLYPRGYMTGVSAPYNSRLRCQMLAGLQGLKY